MAKIDLIELTRGEVQVLTGQPRGVEASLMYKLTELEALNETIQILAPSDLDAITPSFVQGFLNSAFERLGGAGIHATYDFSQLSEHLQEDFEIGLKRLKLRRNVIPV
jgi:hypothetical protein